MTQFANTGGSFSFTLFNDSEEPLVKQPHSAGEPGDGGWAKRYVGHAASVASVGACEKENVDPVTGLHSRWRQHAAQASTAAADNFGVTASPLGAHNGPIPGQPGDKLDYKSPLAPAPAANTSFTDSFATPTAAPSTAARRQPFQDLTKQLSHAANSVLVDEVAGGLKKKRGISKRDFGAGSKPAMKSSLRSMR